MLHNNGRQVITRQICLFIHKFQIQTKVDLITYNTVSRFCHEMRVFVGFHRWFYMYTQSDFKKVQY